MSRTLVLVGHCGPDLFMLRTALARLAPGSDIATVNDDAALDAYLTPDSVLLVNRVLDGRFAADEGVELIEHVTKGPQPPVAMLISNYPDAQAAAVAAGAARGFGKRELYEEGTARIVRDAVGAD